jgi:hypothetical protein
VERIGRLIAWKVEFFPWAEFFSTVQASPVGCHEELLRNKVSVVLWLFLFKGGKVLEVFWGSFGSQRCFGDFLDKTGLTGLPNQPDRFPLLVEMLSPTEAVRPVSETGLTGFWLLAAGSCWFPLRVSSSCWLCFAPRSSSTPVAAWTWKKKLREAYE